jgi:acetyl esterase/lipase
MLRSLLLLFLLLPLGAQDAATWVSQAHQAYQVTPDITYLTANNVELKVDVYRPRPMVDPVPVVVYIHGGGWVNGSRAGAVLQTLPYLEMGFAVVNVQYRLARISLAPAAVEDCRCALRWVAANAKQYGFDLTKIVVTGHSAGGHLALTTGMLPVSAGLDRECNGGGEVPVAAVVNWYGITDVADLLEGPNQKGYAVMWLGSLPDRQVVARRVSPLSYVRKELPAILTIHGDADPTVPYLHAQRLDEALKQAGARHQLLTIPGGKHGGFTAEENAKAYATIRAFLAGLGIAKK